VPGTPPAGPQLSLAPLKLKIAKKNIDLGKNKGINRNFNRKS
jgi:hypothetical protein